MTIAQKTVIRSCQGCGRPTLVPLLDLGAQPVTNRFLAQPHGAETLHRLVVAQCQVCALVQLGVPWQAADLRPCVDWITYREPEDHLDTLVDQLVRLLSATSDWSICGVTAKDDTTLERLRRHGLARTWRVDPVRDLGISEPSAGVETLQEKLTPEAATAVATAHGPADLVLIRHVVEHAHDLSRLLRALRVLMKPRGYLVIEVPDCTNALECKDYTTIWEEHSTYFTPATLADTVRQAGFRPAYQMTYRYPFENSLTVVLQIGDASENEAKSADERADELVRGREFGEAFGKITRELRRTLTRLLDGKKAALFGAGHLACAFVNYHRLFDLFAFAVDDNPHKQGLYLPGSHLPIRPSAALAQDDVMLALTCFAPENEDNAIAKNRPFTDRGGRFLSIFPSSARAIHQLFAAPAGA